MMKLIIAIAVVAALAAAFMPARSGMTGDWSVDTPSESASLWLLEHGDQIDGYVILRPEERPATTTRVHGNREGNRFFLESKEKGLRVKGKIRGDTADARVWGDSLDQKLTFVR
ncbi:MAG TPA: hypothetical protein VFQ38_05770 [Longimicrobiales bacterium]|nr:hypothetical protein [Longimicrobiales bacterium]